MSVSFHVLPSFFPPGLYFDLKKEGNKVSKEKGISNLFQVFIPGWYCYHLTSCIYTEMFEDEPVAIGIVCIQRTATGIFGRGSS